MQQRLGRHLFGRAGFTCSALSCVLAVGSPVPANAVPGDEAGRLTKSSGFCRARDGESLVWRGIQPGDPVKAGTRIVCSAAGSIAYTLPGSGALVERGVAAEEETTVARGRSDPQVPEGTRAGLRADAAVPLSPAELQMRADEQRFQKTVIGGAMIGGAIGAVAAMIGTGSGKDAARSAGIGAVLGGAGGGIDGYVTAKREQAGKNELRAVQAAAKDVSVDNAKLQAFLDSSDVVLKEGKTRLAALKGDINAKRITAQEAEAARKREDQNITSMKTTLAQAKTTKDEYATAAAQFKGSAQEKSNLDAEINRMSQQIVELETSIAQYNQAVSASRD